MSVSDISDIHNVAKRFMGSSARVAGYHIFIMEWVSTKRIPYGAAIGGHAVEWTQDGFITNGNAPGLNVLGEYVRLEDKSGRAPRRHSMLVFTPHDSAHNPDGSPCRDITREVRLAMSGAKAPALTPHL